MQRKISTIHLLHFGSWSQGRRLSARRHLLECGDEVSVCEIASCLVVCVNACEWECGCCGWLMGTPGQRLDSVEDVY